MSQQEFESPIDNAVLKIRSGDSSAFSVIIRETEIKVRIVLAAVLPHSASIDDLAQEVYLTAYKKLDTYELGTDFLPWLKAIARNMALNERRRWIREQTLKKNFKVSVEEKIKENNKELIERTDDTVSSKLLDCIEKLHDPFKSVIHDFYFKRLSSKELATKLGKTDQAVRLMLWRSRSTLAACLKTKETMT